MQEVLVSAYWFIETVERIRWDNFGKETQDLKPNWSAKNE